jgi:hypothetical protein
MNEIVHLGSDLQLVLEISRQEQAIFRELGQTDQPGRHALAVVAIDLAWQMIGHAAGVSVLLNHDFGPPIAPLQRALVEALASVAYLRRVDDRETEAQVFQAYSHLKDIEDFPSDRGLIEERQSILAQLSSAIVEEATRRTATSPKTWSGKRVRDMAKIGGLVGFDGVYGYLSGRTHANRVGHNVRFGTAQGSTQSVTLGATLSAGDKESHACAARRCLRDGVRVVWEIVGASPVVYTTPNPTNYWNQRK